MKCRLVGLSVAMVVAGGCVAQSDPDPESTSVEDSPEAGEALDEVGEDLEEPDVADDPDEPDVPETSDVPDEPEDADDGADAEVEDLAARRAAFECPTPTDRMLLASQASASPGGFNAARDVLDDAFTNALEVGPHSTFEEPVGFMVVEDLVGYYEQNGPDTIDTSFATGNEQGTSAATDAVFIRSLYQSATDVPAAIEFRDGRPSLDRDLLQVDVSDEIIGAAGEFGWLVHNDPSVGISDSGEVAEFDGTVTEFAHTGALEVWWGCWKLVVQVFGPDEDLLVNAVSAEMQDWVRALEFEIDRSVTQ